MARMAAPDHKLYTMFKISNISRIVLALGALALLAMLKFPIWNIYLTAPQYPEGLEMKIWHNTLTGDVKIISALNHYIGMRAISVEMFPEFQYLGTVIMAVTGVCLLLALIGRWWSAITYYLVLAIADALALYDFYRWGYDYGHNLNPTAPIIIPGMAYQPPVIGYKKLLNFEAWSMPDTGGWILMVVTLLSFVIVVYEWWRHRRNRKRQISSPTLAGKTALAAAIFVVPMAFWQCSTGPRPINYGQDACAFCKMTLMDKHFGAEIVTKKGKIYITDDVNCFINFLKKGEVPESEIAGRYITDYSHTGVLLEAEKAVYLRSSTLKTPMASGIAAFANLNDVDEIKSKAGGDVLTWDQVQQEF